MGTVFAGGAGALASTNTLPVSPHSLHSVLPARPRSCLGWCFLLPTYSWCFFKAESQTMLSNHISQRPVEAKSVQPAPAWVRTLALPLPAVWP